MSRSGLTGLRFPLHGSIGILILTAGEAGLALGNPTVATWFTPIMWTGYILLVDGLLARLRGRSWLTSGLREFPLLVMLSVAVWLIFEAYNLHLQNWIYLGLPPNPWTRDLGYFWSFATIMPGVFLTADLVSSGFRKLWPSFARGKGVRFNAGPSWAWFLAGSFMVTAPLLLPTSVASYLFGAVWIGFILLLDPLNERLGLPSLRRNLTLGRLRPLLAYLAAGLVCGLLWEAWNFQAFLAKGAFWVYTFPAALRITGLQYGQMPVIGLLGFPPFAVELRSFYVLLRELLGGNRLFGESPLSP